MGKSISWCKNVATSSSSFAYDLRDYFTGGYDHGKETGTVHIGDHNIIKGAKLWEWGSGPRGQATEGRLTDDEGESQIDRGTEGGDFFLSLENVKQQAPGIHRHIQ